MKALLAKYRELLRFAIVGGAAFVLTLVVNYSLKLTLLREKPVTALAIATIVATVVAYVLSRGWSFHTRGGHGRLREAASFFLVNAVAVALNLCPQLFSRYVLHLEVPQVTYLTQELADFASGMLLGTAAGSAFRWWGYQKWVFPVAGARSGGVVGQDLLGPQRELELEPLRRVVQPVAEQLSQLTQASADGLRVHVE
ncbi:GtrA family protein [Amycolatopsis sp. H20-H5]|uniref:GtrA family protein n=1 Tax=Amycolatopsis sp. H20-H5 TaxID=3046309 RepID=UPI003FA3C9CA